MIDTALYVRPMKLSAVGLIRLQSKENQVWQAMLNDDEQLLQLCKREYYKEVNEMLWVKK